MSDPGRERADDAVGAADDLEHRRLHVDLGREVLAEAGAKQIVERERVADDGGGGADARRGRVTAARRTLVAQFRAQAALEAQPLENALAVFGGHRAVDGVPRDGLGEELRRLAAPVGAHLAQAEPLPDGAVD